MGNGTELLQVDVQVGVAEATVLLAGELDVFTVPQVRDAITRALESGTTTIAVDLAGVSFIDARSVDVLIETAQDMIRTHHRLMIRRPSRAYLRMEKLVEIDDSLLPVDTLD